MKRILLAVSLFFWMSGAHSAIWNFDGGINTGQSAATHALVGITGFGGGFLTVSLDDATGMLDWMVGFGGLSGPAVAAHFHAPALSGATAGVLLSTPGLIGATSGVFTGSTTLDAAGIALMTGGGTYVPGTEVPVYHNIHTASNPAGELRGQLFVTSVVPLPAAAWLLLSSVAALAGLSRRRGHRAATA